MSPRSRNAIPELGGTEQIEEQKVPFSSPATCMETNLEASNFPYMAWTYTDHVEL
ncbi:hypothetical protein HA402_008462, partial [Bradysia odoriphaga]